MRVCRHDRWSNTAVERVGAVAARQGNAMDSGGGQLQAFFDNMKRTIGKDHILFLNCSALNDDRIFTHRRILDGIATEYGVTVDKVAEHPVLPFRIFLALVTIDISGSDVGALLQDIVQSEEVSPTSRTHIDIARSGRNGQLGIANVESVESIHVHSGRRGSAHANSFEVGGMAEDTGFPNDPHSPR